MASDFIQRGRIQAVFALRAALSSLFMGPSDRDQKLRKRERLLSRADFSHVLANKSTAGDEHLVVHVARNSYAWSRLGISTSRRVGNAVCRNRIRRQLREAFRTSKSEIPIGIDVFCVVRAGGDSHALGQSLRTLVIKASRRLGRISRSKAPGGNGEAPLR